MASEMEERPNGGVCPHCGREYRFAAAFTGNGAIRGKLEGDVCISPEMMFLHSELTIETPEEDTKSYESREVSNLWLSAPAEDLDGVGINLPIDPDAEESTTERTPRPSPEERDDTITPEEAVEAMEGGEVIAYENSVTRYWAKETSEGEFVTHFDTQGWLKSPKHRKQSREEMLDELQLFLGSGPGTIWICEDDEEVPDFP